MPWSTRVMSKAGSPQLRSPLLSEGREDKTQNGQLPPKDGGQGQLVYEEFTPPISSEGYVSGSLTFQSLIDKANNWLRSHSEVTVKSCETLLRCSTNPVDLRHRDLSIQKRSVTSGVYTHSIRTLRIWLMKRDKGSVKHKNEKAQQISCHDFIPEGEDTIPKLVHRANKRIENGTIDGRIITIETVGIGEHKAEFKPDKLQYKEYPEGDIKHAFILRVFCLNTPSPKEKIDVKDFIPVLKNEGYEEFGALVDRANGWLKNQAGVRVVNLQSVLVQKDLGPHSETGSSCFYSVPGTESETETEWFRILRVPYAQTTDSNIRRDPEISQFNYEMFNPEIFAEEGCSSPKVQRTSEILPTIAQFINETGAKVICAETVMNPMHITQDDGRPETIFKWLHSLRLFYTGGSSIRDMIMHHASSLSLTESKSKRQGHPRGPIFLGSVTTRNMKYRMIIISAAVFVCLFIIVFISVYYANYA